MNDITLTYMTEIIRGAAKLPLSDKPALHRALKNLVGRGIIVPYGSRGTSDRAPDLFDLQAVCLARVCVALMTAKLEVPAFHRLLAVEDHLTGGPHVRRVSGLENAVAAAIDGKPAKARFDILDGNRGIRGHFEHSAPAENEQVNQILADQEAVFGGAVVASLTLDINAMVDAILNRVKAA
jgi:hypothetical protein